MSDADAPIEPRLADGTPPATPDALFARLGALNIDVSTVEHEPVYTVAESKAVRMPSDGWHTKNLFLRNKKGRMWLVTCEQDRAIDLRALGERLGAGRVSFGSPRRLMEYLGVIPGSVTPFSIMNDRGGAVQFWIDAELVADRSAEARPIHAHPLVNSMTSAITPCDLLRFVEAEGHPAQELDLG